MNLYKPKNMIENNTTNPSQKMELKKYLILIIDDDPINLGVVFDFLENYGF
jgi:hypothetical protein